MTTILSSKGQIVLPSTLRRLDHLDSGVSFQIERIDTGKYLLTRQCPPPNSGLVDLLASCPATDWFQPIPSESTDTL